MSKKINVGIDINEVLRAKWLQFDRFYAQEFGDDSVPDDQQYSHDLFKDYKWEDRVETSQELKDELPENISPVEYQVDETGKAPADAFLFKTPEKRLVSAKEQFNRFMYEDYLFEIHGSAPMMYRNMDVHMNQFYDKYSKHVNFFIVSTENRFSIPPTLFFLSKISSRFKNYKFVDNSLEKWDGIDVLITTDPEILKIGVPWGKRLVKLDRPYNTYMNVGNLKVLQLNDLINNPEFEKIIKYKNKTK